MKDRDISSFDFLQALQKEYIGLEIRSKIYVMLDDKNYFKKVMQKKMKTIDDISKKNRLDSIANSESEYLKAWRSVVPDFGFPNFVYNVSGISDRKLNFPYRGSVLGIITGEKNLYGISKKFNFDSSMVDVQIGSEVKRYDSQRVSRLSLPRTDEFYYYYPGNHFKIKDNGIGILQSYDMDSRIASMNLDGSVLLDVSRDSISRIL